MPSRRSRKSPRVWKRPPLAENSGKRPPQRRSSTGWCLSRSVARRAPVLRRPSQLRLESQACTSLSMSAGSSSSGWLCLLPWPSPCAQVRVLLRLDTRRSPSLRRPRPHPRSTADPAGPPVADGRGRLRRRGITSSPFRRPSTATTARPTAAFCDADDAAATTRSAPDDHLRKHRLSRSDARSCAAASSSAPAIAARPSTSASVLALAITLAPVQSVDRSPSHRRDDEGRLAR